ncbi:MAG: lactonase family protein [Chloracidobacterium sp.]|nr:lactonase family protein [Chloracidobacterium sp.]
MSSDQLTRREFVKVSGAAALAHSISYASEDSSQKPSESLLYVGTYTNGKSEGIYVYRMNTENGELKHAVTIKGVSNPSFLAIDPRRRFLYAANESAEFAGRKGGGVTAFEIDRQSGDLRKLNERHSPGVPCHVSVHPSGRFVLAANYGGGNVVIYPAGADGSLGEPTDVAQHTGKGADPKRQEGPHTHCAIPDAAGRYVFAPDLGIDKVMIYRVDLKNGKLIPNGFYATKAGAGPRHFDFHPSGKFAYVIDELDSKVIALAYDKEKGALAELQTISALPPNFRGTNYCADVHVHPLGKFLYGSNRGHDSIVAFAVDQSTGKLNLIAHEPTQGKWPRNFAVNPTGEILLVANQNTDNVVAFRIDQQTGKLTATGRTTEIPSPVCLKFL